MTAHHHETPQGPSSLSASVILLAAWTGFVSLSYELLWTRIFSFMATGRSYAFPMSLGLFLLGVAIGARVSKRFSSKYDSGSSAQLRVLAGFMIAASIFGWLTIPLMKWSAVWLSSVDTLASLYIICAGAVLFGAQFPLLAHFGIKADASSGVRVSYIYVANIVGSVAGSLLTGFLLMDLFSMSTLSTGLAVIGAAVGSLILAISMDTHTKRAASVLLAAALIALVVLGRGPAFDHLYRDLLRSAGQEGVDEIKHLIESKSGVVTVDQRGVVSGGGVYDGMFNVSFVQDDNFLIRPFSLSAFHPAPKKMLLIGLGSGSWARVVAAHPQAEEITIVEISGDYVRLREHYPGFDAMLSDPRVTVITDDGRRWMQQSDERFDAIISNTTFHWRAMVSNLLSKEFFELTKQRLSPGGVFMYNTTGSYDALYTGCYVFEDCYLVYNMVIASPSVIPYDVDRLERALRSYEIEGAPIIEAGNPAHEAYLEEKLDMFRKAGSRTDTLVRNRTIIEELLEGSNGGLITDDNMRGEWDIFSVLEVDDQEQE